MYKRQGRALSTRAAVYRMLTVDRLCKYLCDGRLTGSPGSTKQIRIDVYKRQTQIYTYVTTEKEKEILRTKHPRNRMNLEENFDDLVY